MGVTSVSLAGVSLPVCVDVVCTPYSRWGQAWSSKEPSRTKQMPMLVSPATAGAHVVVCNTPSYGMCFWSGNTTNTHHKTIDPLSPFLSLVQLSYTDKETHAHIQVYIRVYCPVRRGEAKTGCLMTARPHANGRRLQERGKEKGENKSTLHQSKV